MTEFPVSARLDGDMLARLDKIAEELTKRAAGASVNRSAVVRLAVDRGVAALEKELGLSKRPKRK
jgi:hypothetical protein